MISPAQKRRKFERYSIKGSPIAILKPHPVKIVEIVDISKGGLGIQYFSDSGLNDTFTVLDIYSPGNPNNFDNIPFVKVSDFKISESGYFDQTVRKGCIKFGNLTDQQCKTLKEIIGNFADTPLLERRQNSSRTVG